MKTKIVATAIALFATTAIAAPLHASASDTPLPAASRYMLPRAAIGGPVRLVDHHVESDGSVTFVYEVRDMDTQPAGYAYAIVNAHNASHIDALATEGAFLGYAEKHDSALGAGTGAPRASLLPAANYQGNPMVWGVSEVTDQACRRDVVFAKNRVAVHIRVANFDRASCGDWLPVRARRIANALLTRIP
jgi:hypothetical protein